MIPALIVPYLRPEPIERLLPSIDEPVGRLVVIDNGSGHPRPGAISLPANIGVAGAWNLGLKVTADAPWWAIVNDDVVFGPGDLLRLAHAMREPDPRIVTLDGFSAFAMNRAVLDAVGYFDEAFVPAYCEDCDYEYRCRRAGISILALDVGLQHERSSTIADPHYREQNARTYPRNLDYFRAKWGGGPRGNESYATPFDRGGSLADWTLDPRRFREQRWTRRDDSVGAG